MPLNMVVRFADALERPVKKLRRSGPDFCSTRAQNSCRRLILFALELPAINAALIAPIDVPITQSGSTPASCIAWYTPT